WCYNILEHKQEEERIVFEDPDTTNGFIILPDLKWDGKTKETLYLLAIVHRRDIRTLRDLDNSHLDLLKNIRDKSVETIEKKYDIPRSQLRIYVHYQPSFYHFHVHFTYLKHTAPGTNCERSHLLDTIISNIEILPDYYKKATLSFTVRETDTLYEKYEDIINIIHPVTEKHIQKYSNQNLFIVQETADQYREITEPYLTKGQFSLD
uniref:m7GpppX diphosphatase n=1 Tax=Culicoides sonorensis TaxID=179676 RepID=A0A336N8I7_CULSO